MSRCAMRRSIGTMVALYHPLCARSSIGQGTRRVRLENSPLSSHLLRNETVMKLLFNIGAIAAALLAIPADSAADSPARSANDTVYRTVEVDGLSIFYREAGPKDAPTILLLHGFPSSSRMFE